MFADCQKQHAIAIAAWSELRIWTSFTYNNLHRNAGAVEDLESGLGH